MNRETKMKNLPDKIYLNTGSVHCDDFKELSEVTWSENMTNPGDIEYRLAYTEHPKGKTLDECKDDFWNFGYADYDLVTDTSEDTSFDDLDKEVVDAIFKAGWDAASTNH